MKNLKEINNNILKSFKILTCFVFAFFINQPLAMAQDITMGDAGDDQVCDGTFYDPGGTGDYQGINHTYVQTICSATPGLNIKVVFSSFDIWSGGFICSKSDKLQIFDGPDVNAPSIGVFEADGLEGMQIIGVSGCLTFRFITTKGGGFNCPNNDGAPGWAATISCTDELPATGDNCIESIPFCSNQNFDFPNETSGSAPTGPDYGCLGSEPNPIWYHLKIGEDGPIELDIEQTTSTGAGLDIDFALWGPFNDIVTGCSEVMGGNLAPLQCSYSASSTETIGIGMTGGYSSGESTPPDAIEGQYYIVLLTNYSGQAGNITLQQSDGDGETDCSILVPCSIDDITANVGDCDLTTNTFSVSGEVTFSDEPSTGDLIVEDCNGNSVTFSAPFTSPISYTLSGITSDGASCKISAHFSDQEVCSGNSVTYQNPESCVCYPPDLIINDIHGCANINLNDGIDPSSDFAMKTFYNTQTDAENATNAIINIVSTSGTYWVRAVDPDDPTCFQVYEINVIPFDLSYTAVLTHPECGNSDGQIVLTASDGNAPYTYSIDYDGNNDQNTNGTFTNLPLGNYDITITDADGCMITGDTTLISTDSDDPSFDFDDFCEGASNGPTNIATPGGEFSFNPAVSDGATINPGTGEITNGVGGNTYTVEYALSGTCPISITNDVTVWSKPSFTLSKIDPSCGSSDGSITINGLNATSVYTITYEANGTPVAPVNRTTNAAGEATINNLPLGNYTNFEVSNTNDCSTEDPVGITLNEVGSPTVIAPNDMDICLGESVTLIAGNPDGGTISWDNGVTDGDPYTPTSIGNLTFTVTVLDNKGCSASDQVVVNVHGAPDVDAGADHAICLGSSTTLTATGAATYVWDNLGTGATHTVSPTTATTYQVTGTDGYGCVNTDQVEITVNDIPTPLFEGTNLDGCQPLPVSFTNLTGANNVTCLWDFGDGTSSTVCNNVTHIYKYGGTYSVSLTVTDAIGCSGTYTEDDYVDVMSKPNASFTASPMVTETSNTEVTFLNGTHKGTNTGTQFTWDYGDGSPVEHVYDTTHTFPDGEAGNYIVTLIASNGPDCNDTVKAIIKVEEELIFYVPNTFTPDNNQFNETFRPIFTSGFDPKTYKLSIFNRWGELIFESYNAEIGWDGTYGENGSQIVKQGTYVWTIEVKETGKDKRNTYTGHVTLMK